MELRDTQNLFKYKPINEVLNQIIEKSKIKMNILEIPTIKSYGFILAEDIKANKNIPPFDVSHFDGYAVNSKDLASASITNPVLLRIVGKSDHKESFEGTLRSMETVYTTTGAKVPNGADSIIPLERVRVKDDGYIEVYSPVKSKDHITPMGSDIKEGEIILKSNHIIRPQDVKALLELNILSVKVYKKPSVGILSVGDELTNCIEEIHQKKLETHSLILSKMIEGSMGIPYNVGIVQDDPKLIANKVSLCLEEFDIVVTIGGLSLGLRDATYKAVSNLKPCDLLVRGIRVQPGRVSSVAIIKGKPVIMLPGHIQSMFSGAFFLLLPLLRYLNHLPLKPFIKLKAVMSEELIIKEWISFKRIRFVKLESIGDKYIAKPILGDSSMISVLVKSDGFIIIPEGLEIIKKGSEVDVYLFPYPY